MSRSNINKVRCRLGSGRASYL